MKEIFFHAKTMFGLLLKFYAEVWLKTMQGYGSNVCVSY